MADRRLILCSNAPALPEETIVGKVAVVGMSGSGKTNTARKLAESMLEIQQHIGALDPTGAWWGLRSSADGMSEGFPIVVFGGSHSDAPLRVDSGTMLGRSFTKERFNAIFDMSKFNEAEIRRFSTDFLNEVYLQVKHPVHMFMDEFDIICPQAKGANSEEARSAVNTFVRRGRSRGLGSTMITQNPQDADKSVLNMADMVIAMRTQGSQAIDAIGKWMGRNLPKDKLTELLTTLPDLKTGSGFLWAPQLKLFALEEFLLCETFDSGKTPKMGETINPPKVLAKVDIQKLGQKISESVKQAQEESPEYLKKRIRELEIEVSKGGTDVGVLEDVQRMEAELEELRPLREQIVKIENETEARISAFVNRIQSLLDEYRSGDASWESWKAPTTASEKRAVLDSLPVPPSTGSASPESAEAAKSGPAQRILGALAQLRSIGVTSPPRIQVCVMSKYGNMKSAGFAKAMSGLNVAGLIQCGDGTVTLTGSGIAEAPKFQPIRGNAELHGKIYETLGGPEAKILRQLIAAHPRPVARETLMEGAGYTNAKSSGFAKAISKLSTLGYLYYPATGTAVATEQCFIRRGAQ